MGKLRAFRIQFPDSPEAVFHPGDVVHGRLLVDLASSMKVTGKFYLKLFYANFEFNRIGLNKSEIRRGNITKRVPEAVK